MSEIAMSRQFTPAPPVAYACPEWSLLTIHRFGIPRNVRMHPYPSCRIVEMFDRKLGEVE